VEYSTKVLEPKQTSDDVSVTVEHEGQQSSVSGRYLTVCDGPGGKRRNELGLSIETRIFAGTLTASGGCTCVLEPFKCS
jgi:2-polyprenyl-6-methoxyphenol hydroxylase-like FAD-dependent oxidoreductase